MELSEMFEDIEEYHKKLGYKYRGMPIEDQMVHLRYNALAFNLEIAEFINSFPWKAWRPIKDQCYDKNNAIKEVVDMFFFIGALLEIASITSEEVETMFRIKLTENYNRIERGYNNKPEERR